jgi:hypothetical protein
MVVVPRYANYPEAFDTGKRHTVLGSEIGYFHHVRNVSRCRAVPNAMPTAWLEALA